MKRKVPVAAQILLHNLAPLNKKGIIHPSYSDKTSGHRMDDRKICQQLFRN